MSDDTRRIVPGQSASAGQPPPHAFAALAEKKANGEDGSHAVELPDGRIVLISRPKGSNIARIIMIASELTEAMSGRPTAQAVALTSLQPYIEAVMHVQAIDGKRLVPIMDAASYQTIADNLTDEGINAVFAAMIKHWPLPTPEKIKKNHERSQLS